ncbi:hypothetical protein ACJRW5_13235 [Pseudomonas sp. SH1-B]
MVKTFKVLLSLFGALLVGALGSGLWERVLSPALSRFAEWMTGFISGFSQSYSDSVYASAANLHGGNSVTDAYVFMLVLFSLGVFLYGMHIRVGIMHSPDSPEGKDMNGFVSWACLLMAGGFFSISMIQGAKLSAIKDVRKYSVDTMEIVRPYVGENGYYMLRSKFLRVRSEKDFKDFVIYLQETSDKAGMIVHDFKGF